MIKKNSRITVQQNKQPNKQKELNKKMKRKKFIHLNDFFFVKARGSHHRGAEEPQAADFCITYYKFKLLIL